MNRSWTPPEGFKPDSVSAEGAYLRVVFTKLKEPGPKTWIWDRVTVYENDMGREVARIIDEIRLPRLNLDFLELNTDVVKVPPQPSRWFRFQNGFYLALEGLQEMILCLSTSSSR